VLNVKKWQNYCVKSGSNSVNCHLYITSQTQYSIHMQDNYVRVYACVHVCLYVCVCVCVCVCPSPHLEVWLLEDPGQFGRAVVFHREIVDVPQNIRH